MDTFRAWNLPIWSLFTLCCVSTHKIAQYRGKMRNAPDNKIQRNVHHLCRSMSKQTIYWTVLCLCLSQQVQTGPSGRSKLSFITVLYATHERWETWTLTWCESPFSAWFKSNPALEILWQQPAVWVIFPRHILLRNAMVSTRRSRYYPRVVMGVGVSWACLRLSVHVTMNYISQTEKHRRREWRMMLGITIMYFSNNCNSCRADGQYWCFMLWLPWLFLSLTRMCDYFNKYK